jgi:hypothetical protein
MRSTALLLLVAAPALAQNADIQKQLIQRQQQSDAFTLQLRQSQETVKALPASRSELEARQFTERQRLENLSEKQLLEVKPDTPQALRPYERQKAENERRPLTAPAAEVSVKPARQPPPLVPAPGGIVKVIEAPR